jgi:hypothetical protein
MQMELNICNERCNTAYLSCSEIHQHVIQMSVSQSQDISNDRHDCHRSRIGLTHFPPVWSTRTWAPQLPTTKHKYNIRVTLILGTFSSRSRNILVTFSPIVYQSFDTGWQSYHWTYFSKRSCGVSCKSSCKTFLIIAIGQSFRLLLLTSIF